MFTTTLPPTQSTPLTARPDENPWLLWRAEMPREPQLLTVAELAECACPDLCDRDHANE